MSEQMRVLITGAGGFIGHHLVTYLKRSGYWVRGVDMKPPLYGSSDADEFQVLDLRRFDDIFGPLGTWMGGGEKAPAALCRKVAIARLTGHHEIEIWGDGEQTRSFCYIDDCVEGLHRIMRSDHAEPLNLGQDRMVTVNE